VVNPRLFFLQRPEHNVGGTPIRPVLPNAGRDGWFHTCIRMSPDRLTPAVNVDAVMREIEDDVRRVRRERLVAQDDDRGYADQAMYTSVDALLRRALDREALLLPDLMNGDDDLDLATYLRITSHRPLLGPLIVFVKRRAILPLTQWLFDYSRENFRRQQRVNRILISCVEELAVENARLQQQLQRRGDAASR
jgi:hypothetical protein